MFDLEDDGPDDIPDPDDPLIILGVDNINGFDAGQFYEALGTDETSIRDFRDRLWNMTGGAGNNQADYNNFVDLYDVFN